MKIKKIKSNVESYNNLKHNFSLEIHIENAVEPNIEKFQNSIIKSGDSRKQNIVIEDKMDLLVSDYIDEHNVDSSYNVACYIYGLFEEGHDLNLNYLNNTSFVFIVKNEFEKANALLKEANKKINNETLETEEISSAALVMYNIAVIAFTETNLDKALKLFQSALNYCEANENMDYSVSVLLVVEQNNDEISLKEMLAKETEFNSLNIKSVIEKNILILKNYLSKL